MLKQRHSAAEGGSSMKHKALTPALLISTLFLTLTAPRAAQTPTDSPEHQRRAHAIGFLRTVNTAEVIELHKLGAYSSWPTLLANQQDFLNKFLQMSYKQDPGLQFAPAPEILPGWSLRLEVHADGKGYDIRLSDLTDKSCGYAALSDESGLISQSKNIDCPI
jgi:hypothetical protein